jgi:hypothetical protein
MGGDRDGLIEVARRGSASVRFGRAARGELGGAWAPRDAPLDARAAAVPAELETAWRAGARREVAAGCGRTSLARASNGAPRGGESVRPQPVPLAFPHLINVS